VVSDALRALDLFPLRVSGHVLAVRRPGSERRGLYCTSAELRGKLH
jgi:hypothetical protein